MTPQPHSLHTKSVSSTTVMKAPTFSLSWQSPTRTGSRQPIPLEIFDEIFSYLMPSQDDAFSAEEHTACFLSLSQTCQYFAAVARPVIWRNRTLVVEAFTPINFARSVAKKDPLALHLAQFIKKCTISGLYYAGNAEELEEEDDIADIVACALANMEVEELTITDVAITKKFLKLVAGLAPKLKALTIEGSCHLDWDGTEDDLRTMFGAMRGLERLKIMGYVTQRTLMAAPSMIPVSNLQRLHTDTLFSIDACIAQRAPLTHLEVDGMDVFGQDTHFLCTRLQSFPTLTHISIHNFINCLFSQRPMDIPGDRLPNLISFKGPPSGLVPKFYSLGPKLQVLDCTGTKSERPYIASELSGSSIEDFTATNIRELALFDCNLNSRHWLPRMDKPTPHLRVMRLKFTGIADRSTTVPKMFQELARICEGRTTRLPVEELVITFRASYFTSHIASSKHAVSWVVDLKQQLAMIEGLSDGLPQLKRVLFHGGYLAWVKDVDDGGKWKPRMLNANIFRDVKRLMASVYAVDYMGCLAPFCSSWDLGYIN